MSTSVFQSKFLELLKDLESAELDHPAIKSLRLNIFEAAGLIRQEIKHSNVLAYLLNPNENHGLRDTFFKKLINNDQILDALVLLDNTPMPLKLALSEFDDLIVRREDMQIDILAWSPKNKIVLIIENKIGASESFKQLERYRNKITSDSRFTDYKKIFIYLTPEGESGSDLTWINSSYQLVINTLGEIVSKYAISTEVNLFISHYIELLRKHVMGEENDEIKSLCLTLYEKHRDILDLIYKNIDLGGTRDDAIRKFIAEHQDLHINNQNGSWLSFNAKSLFDIMPDVALSREWHKQNKPIVFFFNLYENQIKIVIEVGPIKDLDYRNKLVENLFLKITNSSKSARTDSYTRVLSKIEKFSNSKTIDDLSSDEILKIMNSLYKNIEQYIETIKQVIVEIDDPK